MEIRILGPLEVMVDGNALDLGAGRGRVLLVALLLHPRETVPVDVLIQGLWGDDAQPAARGALHVQVSRLRMRLGEAADRIVTTPVGYRLEAAPEEIDASRFEALCSRARGEEPATASATLAEALGLWRGPVLADVRYEAFAQPEIARLEELRWSAVEDRLEAELALGRHAAVVAELERAAIEGPVRERLIELRMRALYGAGRHVEALEVYADARRHLDEELGLEPGPALRALEQAILEHDPSLAARPAPARPALPAPPTPTVGRERDLEAVAQALEASRLVTLTGPGGVGKTRLAVETARGLADDRVYVAWLATVADAADVAPALAAAVDVVAQPDERVEDALARRLGGAAALLVADNLEHVLDAAPLLAELLEACPRLRILATSREPLRLRAERCLPVAPLGAADAITLFMDRARDRRPDLALTDGVADLCERLDGLPLALELAAGRVGLLAPEQIVARLGDALEVLEGGSRDAPARQRTIRATLEWSVALLDDAERRAFVALSAFTGGAELEAAERVTDAPLAVLEALTTKSLVALRGERLVMLEVVRQYAAGELAGSPERDAVRERHAAWCLELAERLAPEIEVRGDAVVLRRFDRELGNLRAAFDWLVASEDGDRSLRMACSMAPYSAIRSLRRDGVRALDAALAVGAAASGRARGRALAWRALLTRWNDDQTISNAEEALALAEASGDLQCQCMALDELAGMAAMQADFAAAAALARRQRAIAEQLGDPYAIGLALKRQAFAEPGLREARAFGDEAARLLRGTGSVLRIAQLHMSLVMVALSEEDYEAADELAAEGLRASEEAGVRFTLMASRSNAGLAALFLGRMEVAERRFRENLADCRRERLEMDEGEALLGLAAVAASAGDGTRAAALAGAAEEPLRQILNDADQPIFDRLVERFIEPARAALGETAWAAAAAEGAALTFDERLELALAHPGYHLIS